MLILRKNSLLSSSSSSLHFLPINRISSTSLYFPHFSSVAAAAAAATKTPRSEPSSFIVDYLINSCGFSRQRAAVASKRISHLASPTQPDSVTHFLKHHGFDDAQVRTLVSRYPPILCTDAARTAEPNLAALRGTGLAEDDLRRLVLCNPQALLLRSATPASSSGGPSFTATRRSSCWPLPGTEGLSISTSAGASPPRSLS